MRSGLKFKLLEVLSQCLDEFLKRSAVAWRGNRCEMYLNLIWHEGVVVCNSTNSQHIRVESKKIISGSVSDCKLQGLLIYGVLAMLYQDIKKQGS